MTIWPYENPKVHAFCGSRQPMNTLTPGKPRGIFGSCASQRLRWVEPLSAAAATLTCKIIRRDAKRHLSERGGEGEEKVKAEGLRGLCAVRGCECAGRPLTNVTKNLDPPRAGRLLLEKSVLAQEGGDAKDSKLVATGPGRPNEIEE